MIFCNTAHKAATIGREPRTSAAGFRDRGSRLPVVMAFAVLIIAAPAFADDPVNYQDDIVPIFRQHCFNCHNPDDLRADLDLTSYSAMMQGSSGGAVLEAGQPDASRLYLVTAHEQEPVMPPRGGMVSEDQLQTLREWVESGLRETADAAAIPVRRRSLELDLDASAARPDGPPPMPETLLEEPPLAPDRPNSVTAMAHSPWSPLLAIGGPRQIAIYHTETFDLLGILPFPEGMPESITFSRNGRFVLVGGGYGAREGLVALYNIENGRRVTTVGDEYDAVLAADITADQSRIALGGPTQVVRGFETSTGDAIYQMDDHTDWVQAVAYSPDGVLLASGDRAGNLFVWEAHTGNLFHTLDGHDAPVTAIAWRPDSNAFASAAEDGNIRIWNMRNGNQARSISAHGGGVTHVHYTHDARLVSVGRDDRLKIWNTDGSEIHAFGPTPDLALTSTFNQDGTRAIVGDFAGNVFVYDIESGEQIAQLAPNPPRIAGRIEQQRARIARIRNENPDLDARLAEARQRVEAVEAEIASVHAQRDDLETSIQTLHADDAEWVQQLEALQQKLDDARLDTPALAHQADASAEADAAFAAHLEQIDQWEQAYHELLQQRREGYTQEAQAEAQLTAIADDSLPALEQQLAEVHEQNAPVDAIANQIADHEHEIARLEAAQIYTEIYYARDDLEQHEDSAEVAELVLEMAQQEHDAAEQELVAARDAHQQIREEADATRARYTQVAEQAEQAAQRLAAAREAFDQAQAEVAAIEEKAEATVAAVHTLADAAEKLTAAKEDAEQRRTEAEKKLAEQEQALAEAAQRLAAAEAAHEEARQALEDATDDQRDAAETLADFKARFEDLEERYAQALP